MLRNYLKTALRALWRNKVFSAINIAGLAMGMACSLLILLWLGDELRVNRHHANGPHLYRVMGRSFSEGKVSAGHGTPGVLPEELKKQFPEIRYASGFTWQEPHVLSVGDRVAKQTGCFAGADWFRMYSVPLLAGTPQTALNAPNALAISRKLAGHYFGSPQAALGKTIRIDQKKDYQVTAVFEDLPAGAPDQYDFLLSWEDMKVRNPWILDWGNNGPYTRLMLHPGADPAKLEAKIKTFLKGRNRGIGPTFNIHLFLHPEPDAYLYSEFENGYPSGGRIEYVRLLGVVAAFILLIACINFMNLATARSVKRAKEVGVRKVVGAVRGLLIGQFMGEALLLALLALVVALGLAELLLPAFNDLTGKRLTLSFGDGRLWLILPGITLVTGLLAGSYPALFLSSLNPVRVLKGTLRFGAGARLFRQGLVVFQFAMSVMLIVGTIAVYRQITYVQQKNLGYDRENLINVLNEGALAANYETFKQELLRMPGIGSVTRLQDALTGFTSSSNGLTWPGKDPAATIEFNVQSCGYDLVKTLKLSVRGRDFSPAFGADSTNYLINEAAARRMGYADALGQPLTQWGRDGTIIGVLKDFHYSSLHNPIEPLVIRLSKDPADEFMMIRTQPGQTQQALASLETLYKKMNPGFPFTYAFADVEYDKLYKSEATVGTLAGYFAALAIFISCLGLFGLAAFTAEQRTREVGIRKVLGASTAGVAALLSLGLLKLVGIAILLATPLSWYAVQVWLRDFEYKVPLEWWVFGLAGAAAVLIALLTVSFQSIRAALANPVKSLRSE
ncbi:MAG: Acidobacterial duplicated orphan permease (function unknown) [uncultured Cytophagales bacterium]|uniref:ABC transporter, fused permease protein n=1 Tax=uncultured Cytophagales bacterium TaxID=158755 RepID=A0A6J4JFP3_9SPHI|nr:MAG: Acidobacterial duplicated orphan permease (function unknown) [uncultured Cytophagales bacterium]